MNVYFKNLGLAVGLAFILLACEDPNDLAKDLVKRDGLELSFKDVPVNISLTLMDSIFTGFSTVINDSTPSAGASTLLLGYRNDDYFGTTKAIIYSTISNGGTLNANDSAVFESLRLKLKISSIVGTDIVASQHFDVYKLNENLDASSNYISKDSISYDPSDLIGSVDYIIDPEDADFIDISLIDALGEDFYNKVLNGDDSTFVDDEIFVKYFNGIAVVPLESNTSIFTIDATESGFELDYIQTVADSTDTVTFEMPIVKLNTLVMNRFSGISSNRDGTPIAGLTSLHQNFEVPSGQIGGQAGTGIVPVIRLDSLHDFLSKNKHIKINRAEVLLRNVGLSNLSLDSYDQPNLNIFLTQTDRSNFFVTADGEPTDNVLLASGLVNNVDKTASSQSYSYGFKEYQIITTLYFEDIIDGFREENDLFILPTRYLTSLDQFVLDRNDIKLHLYYSEVK